ARPAVLSRRRRLLLRSRPHRGCARAGGVGPVTDPVVSAIIATYNQAAFVGRAIQSALDQRLPGDAGVEVIVVDDGSTDATPHVTAAFQPRLPWLRQPH